MQKRLVMNQDLMIFIIAFIIIAVGQVASIAGSGVLTLFALALTLCASIMIDESKLIPFLLLLIAPNRLLTYGHISAPTIVMIVGILRSKFKMRKRFFILAFLLGAFSVATVFIGSMRIFDAIKTIVMLLFLENYTQCENIEDEYFRDVKCCSISCIISFIMAVLLNPSSIKENARFTLTLSGQNVLGILCAVMAVNLVANIVYRSLDKKKSTMLMTVALVFIGFFTGSRSFLLAAFIGILVIAFMAFAKLDAKKIFMIIAMCAVAGTGVFLLYTYNSFIHAYADRIIYRIVKLQSMDISNGRFDLWKQYAEVFKQEPIYLWLGNLEPSQFGIEYVAHNMILEQIADFGIIGSVIIVLLYINVMYKIYQNSRGRIYIDGSIASMIALLSASMVSHTLLGVPQTMMLYICFLGLIRYSKGELA